MPDYWKIHTFRGILLLFLGTGAFGLGVFLVVRNEGGLKTLGFVMFSVGVLLFLVGLLYAAGWFSPLDIN